MATKKELEERIKALEDEVERLRLTTTQPTIIYVQQPNTWNPYTWPYQVISGAGING
jgi:hypothetical protein